MQHIHFIGVGGVGMNGLAQLAALSGYTVTGSDRSYDPQAEVYACLSHLGITFFPQDGSGITDSTHQVIYSTAIESDNPDLKQAERFNIPLLHRAEFLKQLIGTDELIAVAGTAGKTTTTGLLGWIFEQLGKDPSVYNGASVLNWKKPACMGNVRKGNANLWIIEADESDKSLLNFHPTHSIITNISKDHYELDELQSMFTQFEKQTSGITMHGGNVDINDITTTMPGQHNLENARCAAQLCHDLGMDMQAVRSAISTFKGVERRLEIVGKTERITVIDDYAHNPAKIWAALDAVSQSSGTVHAYWRPHGFKPLEQGFSDFVDTFAEFYQKYGGSIFLLPVYYAGGTVQRTMNTTDLVKELNSQGIPAEHSPDYPTLKKRLEEKASPGDTILGMGARDPELPLFARQLVQKWKTA